MDLIIGFFPLLILIAMASVAVRVVFPIIMVISAMRRAQAAIAAQQEMLRVGRLQSAVEQDLFVQRARQSADALVKIPEAKRAEPLNQMQILMALAAQQQTGRWNNGAYFEGGNVVIPGGPSLIGGRLYIPGIRS